MLLQPSSQTLGFLQHRLDACCCQNYHPAIMFQEDRSENNQLHAFILAVKIPSCLKSVLPLRLQLVFVSCAPLYWESLTFFFSSQAFNVFHAKGTSSILTRNVKVKKFRSTFIQKTPVLVWLVPANLDIVTCHSGEHFHTLVQSLL